MFNRIGLVVCRCPSVFSPTVASLVLLVLIFVPSAVHADRYLWNTVLTGTQIVHKASSLNRGSGTSVAVIDGLVDCTHWQFLQAGSSSSCRSVGLPGASFSGYSSHATHVASTIGARGGGTTPIGPGFYGVAPKAKILGYGLLSSRSGYVVNAEDIAVADA